MGFLCKFVKLSSVNYLMTYFTTINYKLPDFFRNVRKYSLTKKRYGRFKNPSYLFK